MLGIGIFIGDSSCPFSANTTLKFYLSILLKQRNNVVLLQNWLAIAIRCCEGHKYAKYLCFRLVIS